MINLIKKLMPFMIILGSVIVLISLTFDIENNLFSETIVNGIKLYTFDLHAYTENIKESFDTKPIGFETILPTGEWQTTNANMLQSEFWNVLGNNIAYVIQWIYFPFNFILYIIRVVVWLARSMLTFIGWPMTKDTNGEYVSLIMRLCSWISENLTIPYILAPVD